MKKTNTYIAFILLFISLNLVAQYPASMVRYTSYNISTGNFEIRWDASTAPSVEYYQVYYHYPDRNGISGDWKEVINNKKIYATQDLTLAFDPSKLSEANPLLEPVIIGVQAYDINEESLNLLYEYTFDSTIFLQAEYDSCQAAVNLSWNNYNYKQWTQPGTSEYRIYISDNNGANFTLAETLPPGTKEYNLKGLNENEDYIIYVSAISANNPLDVANSTPVYINTDMAVLPDYVYANFATYENGSVGLSFSIDPNSETNTYNLLRSIEPNANFENIHEFKTNDKELNYTDYTNYNTGPYYYKLEVINYCDINILESENMASSILLKHNGSQFSPVFNWNEYLNWINGVSFYSIERKFGNSDFSEIGTSTATTFTDNELEDLVEDNYAAMVCYKLTAHENGGNNTSTSNSICYELPVNIRFEFDAFMPGSGTNNDSFGPTIDFVPNEYIFKVLDRIGRKVYESKDPSDTRWDGYINGSLAQEGIYMGIVQYRIGNGKKHTIQGAVAVVY